MRYGLGRLRRDTQAGARPSSQDNLREIFLPIKLEALFELEACPERLGEGAQPRRRPHEREGLKKEPDRPKPGPLGEDEIQGPVLHGSIKALFTGGVEPVDLVNQENVSPLEARKKAHHLRRLLKEGPHGDPEIAPHFL